MVCTCLGELSGMFLVGPGMNMYSASFVGVDILGKGYLLDVGVDPMRENEVWHISDTNENDAGGIKVMFLQLGNVPDL